jgi:nitric oxide reductase large subunit
MNLLTLFPIGIAQAWTRYKEGLWMARDASFLQGPFVSLLGQLRILPDTIIIILGVLPLVLFFSKHSLISRTANRIELNQNCQGAGLNGFF